MEERGGRERRGNFLKVIPMKSTRTCKQNCGRESLRLQCRIGPEQRQCEKEDRVESCSEEVSSTKGAQKRFPY